MFIRLATDPEIVGGEMGKRFCLSIFRQCRGRMGAKVVYGCVCIRSR